MRLAMCVLVLSVFLLGCKDTMPARPPDFNAFESSTTVSPSDLPEGGLGGPSFVLPTDKDAAIVSPPGPSLVPMIVQESHIKDSRGRPIRGYARGQGFSLCWGTMGGGPEEVLPILDACARRMQHVQQTTAGSDDNARALFEVLEAIDYLRGTQEVTAPVPPGATE